MSLFGALFQPFRIKNLNLQNRVVMSPMTRSHSPGAVPGENVAAYYRRRAEGGVGLIVTEGVAINHPAAVSDDKIPQMFGDTALAGWKRVTSEVHAAGGHIFPQLWHVGMMRKPGELPNVDAPAVGPSGLALNGKKIGEPLTEKEVEYLIGAYAEAAGNAMKAGFDGIELHGAHGYLIDQFFWDQTNKRTDRFGGDSLAARTRFCVEIVKACRAATSADFPIALRWSQWKSTDYTAKLAHTPQELDSFLKPLADAGVDIFHCSQRRFWETEFDSGLNVAGWTKKLTGKPVITVGSVGLDSDLMGSLAGKSANHVGIDKVVAMLERGEVDLVAVGRALLADAAWPTKVREGRQKDLTPLTMESLTTLT